MTEARMSQSLRTLLSCVLAKPGTSPRTVFGRTPEGELAHISRVPTGTRGLTCPNCGGELVPRRSKGKRISHFAHKASADCRGAGETEAHLMGKQVIEEAGGLMLPAFEVTTGSKTRTPLPSQWFSFERVEVEASEEGYRPDLVGYARSADGTEVHRLIIEVYVTHRVGEEKLDRLRDAGESAIEIDLSKVGRNVDGPDFEDLILRSAPRSWLFHRAEEKLSALAHDEEAEEVARKERKKAFAIAKASEREHERQKAREAPPRKTQGALLEGAMEARSKWRSLDMGEFYTLKADDGIFDVEPIVWRSWLLSHLAPWRARPYPLPDARGLRRMSEKLGEQMRAMNWVKGPFAGELRRFIEGRGYQSWDPVADEIEAFFFEGLKRYGFGGMRAYDGASLEAAGRAARAAWSERRSWAGAVLRLMVQIERHDIDVWLHGTWIKAEDGVDMVLHALGERPRGSMVHLPDMAYEIETGRPRYGTRYDASSYEAQGIALRIPGDGDVDVDELSTARSLEYIRSMHRLAWQDELDAWVAAEARRLLSVFQDLSGRGLLPPLLLRERGMDFLLDEDGLISRLRQPLPIHDRDPLAAARSTGMQVVFDLDRLAQLLERIPELARAAPSPDAQRAMMEAGLRAAFRAEERGGVYRLEEDAFKDRLLKGMTGLIDAAGRWGYGEDFVARALASKPTWTDLSLAELFYAGDLQSFRRATNEIITRRHPPSWVIDKAA